MFLFEQDLNFLKMFWREVFYNNTETICDSTIT